MCLSTKKHVHVVGSVMLRILTCNYMSVYRLCVCTRIQSGIVSLARFPSSQSELWFLVFL